ncbi:MAG: HIT domain-containing protein [Chloroflexota bacterium]|nr:HIT domain-containing protein [Chloroflexota bacterium]
MTDDFYCDEVLSGHTPVVRVLETATVLAFYHTRPFRPVHIVVIPKRHVASLLTVGPEDDALLLDLLRAVQQVAGQVVAAHGACRIITNCGLYQDSQHLHWHILAGETETPNNHAGTQ